MAGIISSTMTDDVEAVAPPPRAQVPDGEERVTIPGRGTPQPGTPKPPGAPTPPPVPGAPPTPPAPGGAPSPTPAPGGPAPSPAPAPSPGAPRYTAPPTPTLSPAPAPGGYTATGYDAAQGTARTYTPTTSYDVARWDPTTRQVTDQETVQGQLRGLLDSGNPLLERARAASDERMAARGLINSSMATTAALDAILGQALQIATPDAQAFQTAARDNQQVTNQAGQFNAGQRTEANRFGAVATNDANQFNTIQTNQMEAQNVGARNAASQFTAGETNNANQFNTAQRNDAAARERGAQLDLERARYGSELDAARAEQQAALQRDTQILAAQLDQASRERLMAIEQNYRSLTTASQTANQLVSEMNARIGSILNDPNIAAENKAGLVNSVMENTRRALQIIESINTVDLGDLMQVFGNVSAPNDAIARPSPSPSPAPSQAPAPRVPVDDTVIRGGATGGGN